MGILFVGWRDASGRWEWWILSAGLALVGMGLATIRRPERTCPPLAGFLWFVVAIAAPFSSSWEGAARTFAGMTLLLFFFLEARARSAPPRAAVGIGAALAGAILFEISTGGSGALWMGNPIESAGAAILLLLCATGAGALGLAAAGAALGLALATTSRALLLGAFLALLLRLPRGRRSAPLWILAAAVFVFGGVRAAERIDADPLAWTRARIWAGAGEMLLARPVTGWGPGAYPSLEGHYAIPDATPVRGLRKAGHAHAEWAEWGAEMGIPGIALLVVFFLETLRRGARDPEGNAALLPLAMLCATFHPLRVAPLLAAAGWILGRAWRETEGRSFHLPPSFRIAPALAGIVMGILAVGAYGGWALGMPPLVSAGLAPTEGFLAILSADPRATDRPDPAGILRSWRVDPRNAARRENLSRLAWRLGETEAAVVSLYDARRSEENHLERYVEIARIEMRIGRMDRARDALAHASALEPLASGARRDLALLEPDPRRAENLSRDADLADVLLASPARVREFDEVERLLRGRTVR